MLMVRFFVKDNRFEGKKVCFITLTINCALSFVKIFFGYMANSYALIADGFHSLSDVASDVLVIVAFLWGRKPRDSDHPYGHGKIETFLSTVFGVVLCIVGVMIVVNAFKSARVGSFRSFYGPHVIIVALCSVLIKEWMYRYNLAESKRLRSYAIFANAWHHRSDAFSSIVVLVGVAGAYLGFPFFDVFAAVAVGVIISIIAVKILVKTVAELVETSAGKDVIDSIMLIASSHHSVILFIKFMLAMSVV